ncbi:MAG: sirohydrochlorin chelatase [Burkholderiales bacterium]
MVNESRAIILFAHGAREAEWAQPFTTIQELVRQKLPDTRVELAFLEIMQPSLPETIRHLAATGVNHIQIIPLFLAQGGHLKHDLPRLVDKLRREHPRLSIAVSPAIGESDAILKRIAEWACTEDKPSI